MNSIPIKWLLPFVTIFCSWMFSMSIGYGQLSNTRLKLWQKNPSAFRIGGNNSSLLNFHYNIPNSTLPPKVYYPDTTGHSIIIVHVSKKSGIIWRNVNRSTVLESNKYTRRTRQLNLVVKPSVFTFVSPKVLNSNNQRDSIPIFIKGDNIYEIIFSDMQIGEPKLKRIHSYLSIKYGISLKNQKYYDSDNRIIWDPKRQQSFIHRPTGIGRDDHNQLYQKQSCNQEDLILTIAKNEIQETNTANSTSLSNKSFGIWADDNRPLILQDSLEMKLLMRKWKMTFTDLDSGNFVVRIRKEYLNPNNLQLQYFMVLYNRDSSTNRINGIDSSDFVLFKKVNFGMNKLANGIFGFGTQPVIEYTKTTKGNELVDSLQISSVDLENIILYPNPMQAGSIFTVNLPKKEDLSISIFNSDGRLIYHETFKENLRAYKQKIEFAGVYLVRLSSKGQLMKTFKLIVY